MRSSTLILTTAASSIVAADTANLFLAEYNQFTPVSDILVAQSLGQDSTATTYLLGCRAGLDLDDETLQDDLLSFYCGYEMPFTITQGPSTVNYQRGRQFRGTKTLTQDFQCSLAGTTSADCTHLIKGPASLIAEYTSYVGEERALITSHRYDVMTGTDAASFWVGVPLVTDAASMMNSDGPLTYPTGTVSFTAPGGGVYAGNSVAVPASSADGKSMVTSAPTGTSTAINTTVETNAVSKTAEGSASASSAATVEGGAAKAMGLGAWAAAMVAGVIGVAAL